MERREFLTAAAVGAIALPAAARAATPSQEAAIKRRLIDWYRAFGNPKTDSAYYRSFMTKDYWLLENGELLDLAGDMKMLASNPPDFQRQDKFDFRHIRIDGNHAYMVYFLASEMTDSVKGARSRRWLESAVLRREREQWRFAVLHSTRINPPAA